MTLKRKEHFKCDARLQIYVASENELFLAHFQLLVLNSRPLKVQLCGMEFINFKLKAFQVFLIMLKNNIFVLC